MLHFKVLFEPLGTPLKGKLYNQHRFSLPRDNAPCSSIHDHILSFLKTKSGCDKLGILQPLVSGPELLPLQSVTFFITTPNLT